MDRNRIFWPQDLLRHLRLAVLRALAQAAGQMLAEADRLAVVPEVRNKMEHTIASFFEPATVDDALFESMHPAIQKLLRHHFRAFLRNSLSKSASPGRDLSAIAAEQGFQYQWQQMVVNGMVQ